MWLQTPELNGPNGLYVDNSNNKLIVASLGAFSNPAGSMRVVDLQNRTVSGLGNEGTTVPIGGLDGIVADILEGIITLQIMLEESSMSSILMEQVMKL